MPFSFSFFSFSFLAFLDGLAKASCLQIIIRYPECVRPKSVLLPRTHGHMFSYIFSLLLFEIRATHNKPCVLAFKAFKKEEERARNLGKKVGRWQTIQKSKEREIKSKSLRKKEKICSTEEIDWYSMRK